METVRAARAVLWTPIRRRGFFLLWTGQSVSFLGDELYALALYWMALEMGSKAFLGLVSALNFLPRLIFSVWAGVIVDRTDPKRIMISADLLNFAIVLLPVVLIGAAQLWALVAAAFFVPLLFTFFQPARGTILPYLVAKEELVPANSLLESSRQLAWVVGPTIAGILAATISTRHLFTLDALTFLFSALTIYLIPWPAADFRPQPPKPQTHLVDVLEGFRYALRTPPIRWLLTLRAIDNLVGMGPIVVGLPILVKEYFAGGAAQYGYLMSSYGAGMLLGSLAIGMWGSRIPKGKAILAGYALFGVAQAAIGLAPTLMIVLILAFIGGLFVPMIIIPIPTAFQEIVPKELLGRAFGVLYAATYGFMSLSVAATEFWPVSSACPCCSFSPESSSCRVP